MSSPLLILPDSGIQRVRIVRNQISKSDTADGRGGAWNAIWVGTHPNLLESNIRDSHFYRDICVEDNYCSTTRRAPDMIPDNGIRFFINVRARDKDEQALLETDPCFERATIRSNDVRGFDGDGIILSQLRYSVVGDNSIRECRRGLVLETNVGQNHVHRNRVIDITGDEYVLDHSLGWNVLNGNVRLYGDNGRVEWVYREPERPSSDHFFGSDFTRE